MANPLFNINRNYSILKDEHKMNIEEYFDKKVSDSKIDIEENQKMVKEIEKLNNKIDKNLKKEKLFKALRITLSIFTALSFLTAIIGIAGIFIRKQGTGVTAQVLCIVFGILIGIALILVLVLVIRKKLIHLDEEFNAMVKKRDNLKEKCFDSLMPLASIMENNIQAKLFQKTLPLVYLDKNFDMAKYSLLKDKYELFDVDKDEEASVTNIQSGHISGNPFVLLNTLKHKMSTKTYFGELEISYQETYTDSKGRVQTRTRYETLHASVTKPYPLYSKEYTLCYGNEAADDLKFSRKPSGLADAPKPEKFIQKKVKEFKKDIQRIQKENPKFTPLANDEFEAIFGATDRNNETQYRLLMTASAQKEFLDMFRNSNDGYQDKFYFYKLNKMNYILPEFFPGSFNIEFDIDDYFFYDFKLFKEEFINLNVRYFKMFYYTLAPILSIQLYQNHKPEEYIYKKTYAHRYPNIQYQEVANKYQKILNPLSKTLNIIKTQFISRQEDGSELVKVNSFGYNIIPEVQYVSVSDSRGVSHSVPVHWDRYLKVVSEDELLINEEEIIDLNDFVSKYEDDNLVKYSHNLLSKLQNVENIKERKISRDDFSSLEDDIDDIIEFNI